MTAALILQLLAWFLFATPGPRVCAAPFHETIDPGDPAFQNRDGCHLDVRAIGPDEVPFFNPDHAPLGAYASLVYGMEASGGCASRPDAVSASAMSFRMTD